MKDIFYRGRCLYCGNRFKTHLDTQKYCCRECYLTDREEKRNEKKNTKCNKKEKNKSIVDIAKKAREQGLTYGQYVALQYQKENIRG